MLMGLRWTAGGLSAENGRRRKIHKHTQQSADFHPCLTLWFLCDPKLPSKSSTSPMYSQMWRRPVATTAHFRRNSSSSSNGTGRWQHHPRWYHASNPKKTNHSNSSQQPQGWIAWYSQKLDTHPMTTMAVSSGLIAGGGDAVCQIVMEQNALVLWLRPESSSSSATAAYDMPRTVRFTVLGTCLVAPVIRGWFTLLHNRIPGTTIGPVLQRVAADQTLFAPPFISAWLSCLWILEGERDLSIIATRIQQQLPTVVVANWGLWIPAQILNFGFVPLKFQVLYSNFVALLWNVYLSYSQTRKQQSSSSATEQGDGSIQRRKTTSLPAL